MGESHCRLTHESCKPSLIIMCVPCIGLVGPGGIFGLRCVGVHSSILVQQLAPLLVRPEACLDLDDWVSTPPSWSVHCTGLVGPGGISGLRQVGIHSSILVRWLAHQQTLGALPDSTVVLIDGIVIHSTYSVCRNVYELCCAPVVLL